METNKNRNRRSWFAVSIRAERWASRMSELERIQLSRLGHLALKAAQAHDGAVVAVKSASYLESPYLDFREVKDKLSDPMSGQRVEIVDIGYAVVALRALEAREQAVSAVVYVWSELLRTAGEWSQRMVDAVEDIALVAPLP